MVRRTLHGRSSGSLSAMIVDTISGRRSGYCEGSHGLSVGSLGEGGKVASVEDILFENTIMVRFLNPGDNSSLSDMLPAV